MNQTIQNFGFPQTLIREYSQWVVLARPQQVTLGALVLAAKSDATAFHGLPPQAFTELATVVNDIETSLAAWPTFEKINYMMLMMVDPHVHFHVIPRYSSPRVFANIDFPDQGWPGLPVLSSATQISETSFAALVDQLRDSWLTVGSQ